MNIFVAILLGIVQGICEFLPISSSGHLLLLELLFDEPQNMFFNILLHIGTLGAVILFFWKDFIKVIQKPISKTNFLLLLSTFCTCCIALAMSKFQELQKGYFLGISFILSGVIILAGQLVSKKIKPKSFSINSSFAVGIMQGIAILPGISRSGTTISTLKLFGLENDESTKISFLLSIPAILGGMFFEVIKGTEISVIGVFPCILGFIFSFLFGLLSLFLLKIIMQKNRWWVFVPYLFAIGIAVCVFQYA